MIVITPGGVVGLHVLTDLRRRQPAWPYRYRPGNSTSNRYQLYNKNRIKSLATEDPDTGELGTCFSQFDFRCWMVRYSCTCNYEAAVVVNKGTTQYLGKGEFSIRKNTTHQPVIWSAAKVLMLIKKRKAFLNGVNTKWENWYTKQCNGLQQSGRSWSGLWGWYRRNRWGRRNLNIPKSNKQNTEHFIQK